MSRKRTTLILAFLSILAVIGVVLILIGSHQPARRVASMTSRPTATLTMTPTATPTATPTETPLPTPIPQFGPITFGTGVGVGQVSPFPAGTKEVYASWTYQGMASDTPCRLSWYLDDNLWSEVSFTWDTSQYGSDGSADFAHIGKYDADGLPPGRYRLELFIGEQRVQADTFVVLAPMPISVPPTATPQPDIQTVGRRAARSLVQIWAPSDHLFVRDRWGSGSIVDGRQGLIVTNWHVVSDWTGALLNEGGFVGIYVTMDPDRPPVFTYWARVLSQYSDPDLDLAVLQITHQASDNTPVRSSLNLPAISLGDSSLVHAGHHVLLLGFPEYAEGSLSWTEGQVVVPPNSQWIKSSAQISYGHSGGMMLNERGELIGILVGYDPDEVAGVFSVARPVNLAQPLIDAAIAAGWAPPYLPPSPGAPSTGERMVVLGVTNLNLRDGPSLSSQVLYEMPRGTVVEVLQEPVWDGERFWYYVQIQGGTHMGWASGVYLAPWEVATSPILFTSDRAGNLDTYSILPNGTGLVQLTNNPGDEGDSSWSPNRDYIVFTSDRSGNADLYVMNATGGSWAQLTSGPGDDIHPVWSPDGSRIAFVSNRDGDWEIFVINADGTGLQQVTFNDAWDSFPAWSPDSTRLVYTSRQTGNYDLYLVDPTTKAEPRQLTTSPYSDAHPSWAPNGDEIVYTMVVPEGSALLREIGVLNIYDPTHPRRVTFSEPGEALNGYADWSPDGRWIVFTSGRDGNEEIYLIPAGGGWAANLTNAPLSNDSGSAWSR